MYVCVHAFVRACMHLRFGDSMHASVYVCVCTCLCFCVCVHARVWLIGSRGEFANTEAQFCCSGQSALRERWKKKSHAARSYSCFYLRPSLWPLHPTGGGVVGVGGACVCGGLVGFGSAARA